MNPRQLQQMAQQMQKQMSQQAPRSAPPPIPVVHWYLGVDGQQHGPFEGTQLPAQVAAGLLTPETLVWTAGMDGWQAARDVAALAPVLSIAPPPLPAAPTTPEQ